MSTLHEPLKRSQMQQTRRETILWTLSLGPPKRENHRPSKCKSLCNKLDVMFKFIHTFYYEYIA